MNALWELYRVHRGAVVCYGLVSEAWIDDWSAELFRHGWTLDAIPLVAPGAYRLAAPAGGLFFELYPTTEMEMYHG